MRLQFTHKSGSRKLILIFAGWSTTAIFYAHIKVRGWDTAVVYGIGKNSPSLGQLREYDTIYLYAWSMGVYYAQLLLPQDIIPAAAYALNGTAYPCDDLRGIPEDIFIGTAVSLSDRNLRKFRLRMIGSSSVLEALDDKLEVLDISELKEQLFRVASNQETHRQIYWTAAYISDNDKIFPPANQLRSWENTTEVRHISGNHYIDIEQIIRHTIIDIDKVGERFSRAMPTYSSHAHAQRVIANRLSDLFKEAVGGNKVDSLIEVGCGTGLFTRAWSRYYSPARAMYIDLCKMPEFGAAASEQYHIGDAESYISELAKKHTDSFDAIVSASAIQWFANPCKFLDDCLRLLRPGGVLAISTFAAGNLPELHTLRPDPMHYPSVVEYKEWLSNYSFVQLISEDVEIDFTTPFEALKHLSLTGVTGSGAKAGAAGIRKFTQNYPQNARGRYSLTFKPLYLIAVR